MENSDSAAASLTRLSPVRIAITFFGRPSLRPTATAVTASGGATTAPRISAVANVSDGTSHEAMPATAKALTTTSPTPSPRIGRMLRRNVGNEKSRAADLCNGGSTTESSTSDSSSTPSNSGANDTANPTTTRTSAGSSPRRCAMAVTTMAPTTTRLSYTRRLSRPDLLLAGRTPEHVAALQLGGADRSTTDPAGLTRAAVDIRARTGRRIRRQAVVVLGPDHDDLSATKTDLHQLDQVGPHRVELGLIDVRARAVRVDPMPVQQLVAVHIADSCDHRLVHQQRADRPAGLADSCPGQGTVGVAPQRVRPESGNHIGDLGLLDHLAHRGAAQFGAVLGADHPNPYLADSQRHRYGHLGERPLQAQMYVHHAATLVVVKQVLAPGGRLFHDPSVDRSGTVDEPPLRAGHHHRGTAEPALLQPGQPVQRVTFWHAQSGDDAGPTGPEEETDEGITPGRPAPAARCGSSRTRQECRYDVDAVRLSTIGHPGTRRRSPMLARRCACGRLCPSPGHCCVRGPASRSRRSSPVHSAHPEPCSQFFVYCYGDH